MAWIKVEKIAERLGVSPATAYRLVAGEIPHTKVRRQYRVEEADFEDWLAIQKKTGATDDGDFVIG